MTMHFQKDGHFTIPLFETTLAEREEVYAEVRDNHQMRPSYVTMLVLACLVATLGLLSDSTAVVIGAMLISPLMNPFLSGGLALALGDWGLGKAALKTVGLSIAVAVGMSAATARLSPLNDVNAEILARTSPNLLDLGIAFFSGCAGTYTLISRKGLTTIPGVAIATAVMPPLCVVGFGLQRMDARIMFGAGSLFLTNLAAIVISAATIFLLASFRASELPGQRWATSARLTVSFLILAVFAIPLATALVQAAERSRLRSQVEAALRAEIERDPARARLVAGPTVARRDGQLKVEATVRTTHYFSHAEVEGFNQSLEKAFGAATLFELDQVLVKHGGLAEPTPSDVGEKITEAVALNRLTESYRRDVETAVSVLGGRLDRYFVTTDGVAAVRIEIEATTPVFPSAEVLEAAARVLPERKGGPANPKLLFRIAPSEPFQLRAQDLAPPGRTADRRAAAPALTAAQAFLRADPEMAVSVAFADGFSEVEIRVLKENLSVRLGVAPNRIFAPDAVSQGRRAVSISVIRETE
jgi:uncharacterized hydrophobic protein (TIGR00271 family)